MNIQDVYNQSKKNHLFSDSVKFSLLRDKIINNFNLSPKDFKNNESLKHLDPQALEFVYKYIDHSIDIVYSVHDENNVNITVIDGKISNVESKINNDPSIDTVNIDGKKNLIEEKFLDFQNYFEDDYVLNLNSLMLNSGYEINITAGQEVNIHITNSMSKKDLTIFQKNLITCSRGSNVFIIEEFENKKNSNNNIANFIDIEEGSNVTHLIFQKNCPKANLQLTSYANCSENSNYKQLILNFSQGSIRNHHYANLNGENASVELDGIFFGSNNQFIDNKTQINHNSPNCISSQNYKGILTDQAKASYLSKTYVDQIAQKTEAYQLSKGILLSDNSAFHSKPELQIFADDVKCSHGSTIGPIDKDLLFYLRSRGLDKKKSTSLLIKSFFYDVISKKHHKSFVEKFNYHSNLWLSENNI